MSPSKESLWTVFSAPFFLLLCVCKPPPPPPFFSGVDLEAWVCFNPACTVRCSAGMLSAWLPLWRFPHCVYEIKLPLLSRQLPASNTTWLLWGDHPPPILPIFSIHLFFPLCVILLNCYHHPFGLSFLLTLLSTNTPPFIPSWENKPVLF